MTTSHGSTVVEYLPHHPKVEGSSLAAATDTAGDKMAKKIL